MIKVPVITIDGPGGTGKGTLSRKLARTLGWHFLDSGSLYRLLALAAIQKKVNLEDEIALARLTNDLSVKFREEAEEVRIILNDIDVTEKIRTELCGQTASKISVFQKVRSSLLRRQRLFRQPPGLIADGRDMGTVVFPDALLKIFLTASQEERAKRRYNQLKRAGINVSLAHVLTELQTRDLRDQNRAIAPLKPADDAIVIDTTTMTIDQTYAQVMQEVEKKWPSALQRNTND